jgi:uncharacterized repeat protein (TIGR01451 family)
MAGLTGMAASQATVTEELTTDPATFQPGVTICRQAPNVVPNPGFEGGIGVENGWVEAGDCTFLTDPGRDSPTSARLYTGEPLKKNCQLLSVIDEIPVEANRFYDYGAWLRADLAGGDAHLAVTFWQLHGTWKRIGEVALTEALSDTQGSWVEVSGSVQVPPEAEYARVEATLAAPAAGSVWFDDVYLGLSTCVQVAKQDDPDQVLPGDLLTYTLAYSNTGREAATGLQIVETYDDNVALVPGQTDPPPDLSDNVWLVENLEADGRGTITAVVQVDGGVTEQSWLFNTVEAVGAEILTPVSATLLTRLVIPTMTCGVDLLLPDEAIVGQRGETVHYDLGVRNVGDCGTQCTLEAASPLAWSFDPPDCSPPVGTTQGTSLTLEIPDDTPNGTNYTTLITVTCSCSLPCTPGDLETDAVQTKVVSPIWLPSILKNVRSSAWESEPNDECGYTQADGPLDDQRPYFGYTDDEWDWWRIEIPGSRLQLDLTVSTGEGIQMGLAYGDCSGWVEGAGCYDNTPEDGYQLDCALPAPGRYYLGIYTEEPYFSYDTPYVLWVTFID